MGASRAADRRGSQRGSAALFALVVVMVAALLIAGVSRVGEAAVQRARADAAADLAALAAVHGGRGAAEQVAAVASSHVLDVTARGDGGSEVVIQRGGVLASAAAAPFGDAIGVGRDGTGPRQ